jgi:Lon protease-like protein
MSDDFTLPLAFDGTVRLFPLPNVVLFPHVTLPLHIFEPRYRQMAADALLADRLITMVLLKPGFEAEYEKSPPLYTMACVGKIIADHQLEDGRYNILLRGLRRARLVKELTSPKPYRLAQVELLPDDPSPAQAAADDAEKLAGLVTDWLTTLGLPTEHIVKLLNSELPQSTLCDILGFALPMAIEFKQGLLEEPDVAIRLRRLVEYLGTNEPPKAKGTTDHKFPPDFSSN